MTTLDAVCTAPVLTASRDTTIVAAARMMREAHVGALVVVDDPPGGLPQAPKRARRPLQSRPVGIVTDRDIVMAIVALDLDPNVFLLCDLLNRPLVTAAAGLSIRQGLAIMNAKGIRRLPLVNAAGGLTGMVTLDDIIIEAARDLGQAAGVIEREITSEIALRPSRIRARKAHAATERVTQANAAKAQAAQSQPRTRAGATARRKTSTPAGKIPRHL